MRARSCSKSFKLDFSSYMNQELPDVQPKFQRGKGTRDQIANIRWIMEKLRELKKKKHIYFCFIDFVKAFDCVDHNKLWNILKEMGIPGYLSCPLRKLYSGKKKQLEPDMKQQNGSKLGKKYNKAICMATLFI